MVIQQQASRARSGAPLITQLLVGLKGSQGDDPTLDERHAGNKDKETHCLPGSYRLELLVSPLATGQSFFQAFANYFHRIV